MRRDVDRLVDRLDIRFGASDWLLGRWASETDGAGCGIGDWYLYAWWNVSHFSPDGGWQVEVKGRTIREVLVRALWVSR